MANPSIAMIPSGYKAGTLYNPLPNEASGDFDVVRNSIATRVNSEGLIETVGANVPRLDYTNGGCPVLLTEPARTNLITNSALGAPTQTVGITDYLAPDGTNSAYLPEPTSTSSRFQRVLLGGDYASGTEFTYSWYRKRVSTPAKTSYFGDLWVKSFVNGTFSTTTQIESDISGYDRFSVKCKISDGSLDSTFRFYYGDIIGLGNSSIAYWGHQLEEGSYATSLIPTTGSILLREGDVISGSGTSSDFNSTEGVLFLEASALANDLTTRIISLSNGTGNERLYMFYNTQSNAINVNYRTSGSTVASITAFVSDIADNHKIAFKYKSGDFSLFIDGVEVGTDSNTTIMNPNTLNELAFAQADGTFPFHGKTSQVQVFKSALTDLELETISSWSSFSDLANNFNYNII